VELVKGQNTIIDASLAFQLSIISQGWEFGVVLGGNDGFKALRSESGLSLSSAALFINISDIEPSINMIVLYAKRGSKSSGTVNCCLVSSLTSMIVAQCNSGVIETALTAIELVHIYKIGDKWKIKSYFQGYKAGINELLSSRGILVPNVNNEPARDSTFLSKLDFTLNWNPSCSEAFNTSQAYIGTGTLSITTLNLSCLYVLKSGQRGLIHGGSDDGSQGSKHGIPFAQISNDYDTGKCTLEFNTELSHKMYKYIVCVEITEGSRCWEDIDASLKFCNGSASETQMINSPLHTPIYVYAVLEILNGVLKTKVVNQYFTTYEEIATVSGFSNA
jgi:uncharacterized protein involved in tellurium resistance